ncbi:hypothetical protein ColLi_12687 [Colletotrichum liriopes]|uniref:Uncharacterized protein n=1 Tax=Colletotrichum liriopes TaxID=708192 RepID=A0AA37GYU7_9PEZI|nr:hypothetical protein ColLi_12687 [Colletotrichum liriopes]
MSMPPASSQAAVLSGSERTGKATLSVLSQRDPAVWDLLQDLERAFNVLADGPGATIAELFPRLQTAFCKSAWAIHAAKVASNIMVSKTTDPVFSTEIRTIHRSANGLQRLRKAANDLGCSFFDLFLDFGTDIAKSIRAIQAISKAVLYSQVSKDVLARALWQETLSRPDLSPDALPCPSPRELTRAINSKSALQSSWSEASPKLLFIN